MHCQQNSAGKGMAVRRQRDEHSSMVWTKHRDVHNRHACTANSLLLIRLQNP